MYITIGIAVIFFWLPIAIFAATRGCGLEHTTCDFYAFFSAGKSFLLGQSPYFLDSQSMPIENISIASLQYTWFIYPPTLIPFWGIFALVNYFDAQILWLIFNVTMGVCALILIYRYLPASKKSLWVFIYSLLFIFSFPLLLEIRWGNTNFLVGCLMGISFIYYERHTYQVASHLLVLASFLKLYPIFYIVILVVKYRNKLFIRQLGVDIILGIISSLFVVPILWYQQYFGIVLPRILGGRGHYPLNQSFLELFGVAGTSMAIPFLSILVVVFFVFLYKISKQSHSASQENSIEAVLLYSMGCSIALGFSGYVWPNTFVILLYPLSLLLTKLQDKGKKILVPLVVITILCQSAWTNMFFFNKVNAIGNLLLIFFLLYVFFDTNSLSLKKENVQVEILNPS